MSADSELLLFTNEKELQTIRKWYELIAVDSSQLIKQLAAERKSAGSEPEGLAQSPENQPPGKSESNKKAEDEEELTLEDYYYNLIDSYQHFNRLMSTFCTN